MNHAQDKPLHQRPEHPDFWDLRFAQGCTPWESSRIAPELVQLLQCRPPAPLLIPGCGSAQEAAFLATQGWPVTALDFSAQALERARTSLAGAPVELVCADFFHYTPAAPYALIYEQAFLCALPRKLWPDWALSVARLTAPGGLLAGFFFVCDQLKGPPFGISAAQLHELLSPWFECHTDAPACHSIPLFAGRERWQIWQRNTTACPPPGPSTDKSDK